MINPLAVATDGYLNGVLGMATSGYIVIGVFQTTTGGGGTKTRTVYAPSLDELEALRRDDEEILTIIVAATKIGIF
ncbi:MAG: hypothetical protein ACPHHR_09445 [Cycloclasticus sp.]